MKVLIAAENEVFRFGLSKIVEHLFNDTEITLIDTLGVSINEHVSYPTDLVILRKWRNDQEVVSYLKMNKYNSSHTKVLVLVDNPNLEDVKEMFQLGVRGYLHAGSGMSEVMEAIRCVNAGDLYVERTQFINFLVDSKTPQYASKAKLANISVPRRGLSVREFEVARYLVEGFNTGEISKINGRKLSTISTQKQKIFKKLQVKNVIELKRYLEATPE